jgi:hypothetical protein
LTDPRPCGACGNFFRTYEDYKIKPRIVVHNVCFKYSVQQAVKNQHCPCFVLDMRQSQLKVQ